MQSTGKLSSEHTPSLVKRRRSPSLKTFLLGCGAICLISIGSCVGGLWYLGHKGKDAVDQYLADREETKTSIEALNTPNSIPDWVPEYPNSVPGEIFNKAETNTGGGFFRSEINGPISPIVEFYDTTLVARGFNVETRGVENGQFVQLVATESAGSRTIAISLSKTSDGVSTVVRYLW